ncbi:chemotaxis protein CheD [Candidatus Endobugula sertula]|uniref:Probable chemoreceptor glutamine deamidase CheD n=1 Tax=Candidatus Endobugula sertula TaxID=62101 RepID=A0A1D2QQU2_9GAMM|nr:chemotaxis protein CheD [Candidatus Endobugula sertula]
MKHGLKKTEVPQCLPGFESINRFWNKKRECFVAKILPGELYVSRLDEMIATTLGSCVSACIWDQRYSIGGMNHFMLPLTDIAAPEVSWGNIQSDATRYGNYAMEYMINEVLKNGGHQSNLQAKVFGGAKIFNRQNDVGAKNAEFVLEYLHCENIPVISQDLGDTYARRIMFDPKNGKAFMKKIRDIHNSNIVDREINYQHSIEKSSVEGDIELF